MQRALEALNQLDLTESDTIKNASRTGRSHKEALVEMLFAYFTN